MSQTPARIWTCRPGRPPATAVRLRCDQLEDRLAPAADPLFADDTTPAAADPDTAAYPFADYNLEGRYSVTAGSPGPLPQGTPTVVRWGFLPDGVSIPGANGEATSASNLITTLDATFGAGPGGSDLTQRPWFHVFSESFARLDAVSGVTYVYEPHDDGAVFVDSPGVVGTRPDVRIGGHRIDGAGGTLAYDYYPDESDMVIDTADLTAGRYLTPTANDYLVLRNVVTHEAGHGLGLEHEMPVAGAALMEPFITTAFDGPQFDDILALQRLYGDARESGGGNDTLATASLLGAVATGGSVVVGASANVTTQFIAPTATDFVSIDGPSDTDVFSFTFSAGAAINLSLLPVGPTYLSGPQSTSPLPPPPPISFNAAAQSDLKLELLDSTGTVVRSANVNGLGAGESILNVPSLGGGTYYARVTGTQDAAQFYQLTVAAAPVSVSVAATITRGPTQPANTNTGPVRFVVTFATPVTGFDAADVRFTAGTITTGLTATISPNGADGSSYFVDVSGMTGTGTVGIAIPDSVAVSALGNLTLAATTPAGELVAFDTTRPVAAFAPAAIGPTNAASTPVTLTFSKPVVSFGVSNLQLTNATVADFTPLSDGRTFTFNLLPVAEGSFGVSVPDGAAVDVYTNPSTAATLAGTFDATAPTATVTTTATDPTNLGNIPVTVHFSEPMSGFSAGGITIVGPAVVSDFQAVGDDETFTFNLVRTGDGAFTVTVAANAGHDAAGNGNTPGTLTGNFDTTTPTVTVTTTAGAPTNLSAVPVTVTFSEPVAGFTAAGVVVSGAGGVTDFQAAGDGRTFTFTLPHTTDGAFTVAIPAGAALDLAGNASTLGTLAGYFDTTGPTPAVVPDAVSFTGTPATFTVTFDDDPRDPTAFTPVAVEIGGTALPTKAAVSPTADPRMFIVTVSGMTLDGTVTVRVLAGSVTDALGNPAAASTVATTTFSLPPPPPLPPLPHPPTAATTAPAEFAVGSGPDEPPTVRVFDHTGSEVFSLSAFDKSVTGGVRVAVADFTGDGVPDVAVGTGPGSPVLVRVFDGVTRQEVFRAAPFDSFTGGVFVAAGDITGDGAAELVVTPDEGGGPRVTVFRGRDFARFADFLGIEDQNFRGGARAAVGDLTGDGRAEVVVAAGFGGGPRVSVYDGAALAQGQRVHPVADFLLFDPSLRNGVYVAVGDVDGDGTGDLVGGAGPGGGPRVLVISGRTLLGAGPAAAIADPVANFFAGDEGNRGGVRVAVKDLDGDANADLVVGDGAEAGSRVTAYRGADLADGLAPDLFAFDAFPGSLAGVFVG